MQPGQEVPQKIVTPLTPSVRKMVYVNITYLNVKYTNSCFFASSEVWGCSLSGTDDGAFCLIGDYM